MQALESGHEPKGHANRASDLMSQYYTWPLGLCIKNELLAQTFKYVVCHHQQLVGLIWNHAFYAGIFRDLILCWP